MKVHSQPRVLVTRSNRQASELGERLRTLGMEPVLIPAIETVEPSTFAPLDEAIACLFSKDGEGYHWLLFTSANAVEAFARRRQREMKFSAGKLVSGIRVAAIGAATARALREVAVEVDLVPKQAVAEAFAEALLPYARQADGSPTRFLLLRAEEAREYLPDALRAAGGVVTIAPVYRTVIPEASVAGVRALFAEDPTVDAITFTSSSSAHHLLALCCAAGVELPETSQRISIGPITSQTLTELGYPPHAEASEASVDALAAAVARLLHAGWGAD